MIDVELSVEVVDFFLEITRYMLESCGYFFSHMHIWEFRSECFQDHREVFLDQICSDNEPIFTSEIFCEMEFFEYPYEPFGGVKMIPRYTIAVIIWESVVIVMIPFSESEECEEKIIDGCELFCVGF